MRVDVCAQYCLRFGSLVCEPVSAGLLMACPIGSGVEGFTTQEDQEMISRIEKQLKRRFAIGSQVSEHSIIQDFTKQVSLSPAGLYTA